MYQKRRAGREVASMTVHAASTHGYPNAQRSAPGMQSRPSDSEYKNSARSKDSRQFQVVVYQERRTAREVMNNNARNDDRRHIRGTAQQMY